MAFDISFFGRKQLLETGLECDWVECLERHAVLRERAALLKSHKYCNYLYTVRMHACIIIYASGVLA